MNKTSPPNHWPAVILFLAAIGIPSAAGITFAQTITQHPWQAVGIALLYEVGVVFVGLLTGIWQQLQTAWVKRIADWIDARAQTLLSGYWKHYCRYLTYEHRDFDVKGLSTQGTFTLSLEQVFVELSIDPRAPHQTSTDPLQILKELSPGEHPIWEYVCAESLKTQQLVLLGPPGSGKTTLLKYMSLSLVTKRKSQRQQKVPYKTPFLLLLREYSTSLQEQPDFSLVDAIHAHLKKWERPVPSGWVERRLESGRCLILLDGLDEVADPEQRKQMVNWVQQQMVAHGNNRFLITSRPFGYRSNPLNGVTVLEVHPFTPEQIQRFVHNWYLANEVMSSQRNDAGVQMKAKEGAEDLLQRLRKIPALQALAVNPLLLTMIATVHRYRSSLPGKRVALYAEICEVFLGKRQEARGIPIELSPAQKLRVLQPLAYTMMREGVKEIPAEKAQAAIKKALRLVNSQLQPEAFLKMVEDTSGIVLEREAGRYSFAHLTFQEYLAATYIRDTMLVETLKKEAETSWWHETIRLYCAQADATPILITCLANNPPSIPALILALDCQEEALEVQPAVSAQLDTLLKQGVEDKDPERRRIVTEALLARRLREMVHVKEDIYTDSSFITCAEYQVFLDEQRALGESYRPDHWKEDSFLPGEATMPILGVRPSDAEAFCEWLTKREKDLWRYRLPRVGEYQEKGEKIIRESRANIGYWLDRGGFAWIKETASITALGIEPIDLTFDLALALDPDLARALDPDLARALDPDLDLDLALSRARALAPDLDLDPDLVLDRVLDLDSDRALARVLASALDRALASALARDLDRALASASASVLARDLALARALASVLTHANIPARNHPFNTDVAFLLVRAFIYSQALERTLSFLVLSHARRWWQWRSWRKSTPLTDERSRISIYLALNLYVDLLIIERRKEGHLPACEGILLVKESKQSG